MQIQGEKYQQAVNSVSYTSPNYEAEGFNGYIETTITFEVKDLKAFTELYMLWYTYDKRTEFYHSLKQGHCK